MASRRRRILEEIETRLQAALPAAVVLIGRLPKLGPDDKDLAISILPGEDAPDEDAPRVRRQWEIAITVIRRAGEDDDVWLDLEDQFATVMTAIEGTRTGGTPPGTSLGGRCSALIRGSVVPIERTEGTRAEGAEITYTLAFPSGVGLT